MAKWMLRPRRSSISTQLFMKFSNRYTKWWRIKQPVCACECMHRSSSKVVMYDSVFAINTTIIQQSLPFSFSLHVRLYEHDIELKMISCRYFLQWCVSSSTLYGMWKPDHHTHMWTFPKLLLKLLFPKQSCKQAIV